MPDNLVASAKRAARVRKGFASLLPALSGPRLGNMSRSQRIRSLISVAATVGTALAVTGAMLFVPAVLISGKPTVVSGSSQQLQNLLMLGALQLLAEGLNGLATAECTGFRTLF